MIVAADSAPGTAWHPVVSVCSMDQQQEWRRGRAQMTRLAPVESERDEVDEEEERLPEQCFYASFKIYLAPVEPASEGSGPHPSGGPLSAEREVFRIERTIEAADIVGVIENDDDDDEEEDEPTLSFSNPDLRQVGAIQSATSGEGLSALPPGVQSPAWRKRSTSESDTDREAENIRASRTAKRSIGGRQQKGFESTQSVDRCDKERASSPVFFLDPEDWYRSEGCVPTAALSASKLLASTTAMVTETTPPSTPACIVRSESDENLDAELERIAFMSEALRRTQSEGGHSRSESATPNFRPRSSTPGRSSWRPIREEPYSCDRNRKVAIPVLWRRGVVLRADKVTSCESLSSLAGSRRSLDVEALWPLSRGTAHLVNNRAASLRSLSAIARLSSEDIRRTATANGQPGHSRQTVPGS